jgi:putative flippase GtrA
MALKKQLLAFIIIGVLAAFLHLLIVWLLVSAGLLRPLQANIIGFLGAVNVSYFGHSHFTFAQNTKLSMQAFLKFFSVALASFLINQLAYYYGLTWFGQAFYLPILVVVLVLVAVFTFICSKFWVFTNRESSPK